MTQNIAGSDTKRSPQESLIDWKEFWQSGAFLRTSHGEYEVYLGPFTAATLEDEADLSPSDFFTGPQKGLKAATVLKLKAQEFRALLESQLAPRFLGRADFERPDRAGFEESFRLIQGKIQRGEIEKAVPMLRTQAAKRPKAGDLAHSIFSLMNQPAELNVYGFWHEGQGVLGATPELLFRLKHETLHSMALAGSAPKHESANRLPLLKDPKELKEHQLVVDDLSARLKGLGWMRKENTQVLELPTLRHLYTAFEVNAVRKKPAELIKLLHPTAALGVAPRAYGYQWMQELPDQKERGQYGAPLMFRLRDGEVRVLVCIRSLFWSQKISTVYAGCGVVEASVLEREWDELAVKVGSTFEMLGLE